MDGVERIHAFAPVGGMAGDRLFITAGRSSEAVFADPTADMRRFLLLAAIGLLLAPRAELARDEAAAPAVDLGGGRRGTAVRVRRPDRPRAGAAWVRRADRRGDALNSAAEDIERRQAEQARLLAELVAAEEETRRRIAADIHDDTAQAVAAAGLRMDALASELTRPGRQGGCRERADRAGGGEPPFAPAPVRAAPSRSRRGRARRGGGAVPHRRVRARRGRLAGGRPPGRRALPGGARDPLPGGARGAHQRAKARRARAWWRYCSSGAVWGWRCACATTAGGSTCPLPTPRPSPATSASCR